tara:strand:+ start:943 stop:1086 length:144 start_codon:yes stop_codon:yes gene_type:complete
LILNGLRRFLLVFDICQYILQPVKKKIKKFCQAKKVKKINKKINKML